MTTALLLTASLINSILFIVAVAMLAKTRDELAAHTASLDGSGSEAITATAQVTHVGAPSLGIHHPSKEAIARAEAARLLRLRYERLKPS